MNILLLSGSFREGSYNQALLEETRALLASHQTDTYAIETLPFYDESLDGDNKPAVVQAFIDKVSAADAMIVVTPEFNHSVPAVLKNALDWASRPAFKSPLKGLKVTMMTASPSPVGGVHAQNHVKQILDICLCHIYPAVPMSVPSVHEKFDNGKLVDEKTLERLKRHIEGFVEWASS